MKPARDAILDLLDKEGCGLSMTALASMLPEYTTGELKDIVVGLYAERRVNRIPVLGPAKRFYVYLSLYVPITSIPREEETPAPVVSDEQAARMIEVLERDLSEPAPAVERRVADRRASRIGVMDVIDRWKLGFRLSRIIEIVGGARNRKLTREDAEAVAKLIRDHVEGQA